MATHWVTQSKVTSVPLKLLAIAKWVCLAWFAIFMWLFYDFYWKFRQELSLDDRYYNPEDLVVYHAQSKFILVPAFMCLAAVIIIHYIIGKVRLKAANNKAQ